MPNQPSQEQIECLERAINEVDALQAIYGTEEENDGSSVCIVLSKSELETARSTIDCGETSSTISQIELQIKTTLDDGTDIALKCQMPPGYPQVPAVVTPSIEGIRRKLKDELSAQLNEKAEAMVGFESIMELVEELKELVPSYLQQEESIKLKGIKSSAQGKEKSDMLYAVIEFHHMLIGSSHKKEAAALNAADGIITGFIYMGGPSCAVVEAAKEDLLAWLADCKRAGKEGTVMYWRIKEEGKNSPFNNYKLKVMPYASGKDNKMDTKSYKETLNQLDIPFPLPECSYLQ